jgi:hypothetical protein
MLVGPKKTPWDFNFGAGEYHLIVNDQSERMKGFRQDGEYLWNVPCLARGQRGDNEWKAPQSDTPPGLYLIGTVYRDYESPENVSLRDKMAFGWYSFDMIDLEGQESDNGRAGIMLHGGGSGNGWPKAWAPHQTLLRTWGCLRMHNIHLRDYILPLVDTGKRVFISVYQEA